MTTTTTVLYIHKDQIIWSFLSSVQYKYKWRSHTYCMYGVWFVQSPQFACCTVSTGSYPQHVVKYWFKLNLKTYWEKQNNEGASHQVRSSPNGWNLSLLWASVLITNKLPITLHYHSVPCVHTVCAHAYIRVPSGGMHLRRDPIQSIYKTCIIYYKIVVCHVRLIH